MRILDRIPIVDDDEVSLEVLEATLTSGGYEVLRAHDDFDRESRLKLY